MAPERKKNNPKDTKRQKKKNGKKTGSEKSTKPGP